MVAGLLLFIITSSSVHAVVNLRMQTDLGAVDIELFDEATPETVINFMNYVNRGDYEGTFIHRHAVVATSGVAVVQMGGWLFDPDLGSFLNGGTNHIPVDNPVANESGISNLRGTIAMARTSDPESATSEIYFNLIDNVGLDDATDNGIKDGYAVFGQVLGDGMEVIDAIAAVERCAEIVPLAVQPCNAFPDLPLVHMQSPDGAVLGAQITLQNLVNWLHIGSDSDGDGIADSLEDEGANAGDVNNDSTPDRDQQNIATYRAISGNLITLEAAEGVVLEFTAFMGKTFAYTTYDVLNPPAVLDGLDFFHGHLGFDLNNITDPDGKAAVTISGAGCLANRSYYQYGPTPDDNVPHWYEFLYDEATDTGAEYNGNVITLHYVDGARGDSALGVAGVIETRGGVAAASAVMLDDDNLPPSVEDGAPHAGDGNNDGICDSEQDNVASISGLRNDYITIEAPAGFPLSSVDILSSTDVLVGQDLSALGEGVNLAYDFLTFRVDGLANNGDSVDVRVILPEGNNPISYFMLGPTPDNGNVHLYEFLYDAATGTGAEFNGNEILLHFVDGERGDFDLTANGKILDPGAPALFAASVAPSGGGGGGCSLVDGANHPAQAGAWYLLLFLIALYGSRRYCLRICVQRVFSQYTNLV